MPFNHFYSLIFEITLRMKPLFFPSIAHERTTQNLILSVRSSFFFLNCSFAPEIKGCSRAKSDFKERCAQLWYTLLLYGFERGKDDQGLLFAVVNWPNSEYVYLIIYGHAHEVRKANAYNYIARTWVSLSPEIRTIQEPVVTRILRDQKIPVISFVANTGGLLGLCMGFRYLLFCVFFPHCFVLVHVYNSPRPNPID